MSGRETIYLLIDPDDAFVRVHMFGIIYNNNGMEVIFLNTGMARPVYMVLTCQLEKNELSMNTKSIANLPYGYHSPSKRFKSSCQFLSSTHGQTGQEKESRKS